MIFLELAYKARIDTTLYCRKRDGKQPLEKGTWGVVIKRATRNGKHRCTFVYNKDGKQKAATVPWGALWFGGEEQVAIVPWEISRLFWLILTMTKKDHSKTSEYECLKEATENLDPPNPSKAYYYKEDAPQ